MNFFFGQEVQRNKIDDDSKKCAFASSIILRLQRDQLPEKSTRTGHNLLLLVHIHKQPSSRKMQTTCRITIMNTDPRKFSTGTQRETCA